MLGAPVVRGAAEGGGRGATTSKPATTPHAGAAAAPPSAPAAPPPAAPAAPTAPPPAGSARRLRCSRTRQPSVAAACGEMWGRYTGDIGGDIREIYGRYTGDIGRRLRLAGAQREVAGVALRRTEYGAELA